MDRNAAPSAGIHASADDAVRVACGIHRQNTTAVMPAEVGQRQHGLAIRPGRQLHQLLADGIDHPYVSSDVPDEAGMNELRQHRWSVRPGRQLYHARGRAGEAVLVVELGEILDIHVARRVDLHILWVFEAGERQHDLCRGPRRRSRHGR
jgi:hypothetical protein